MSQFPSPEEFRPPPISDLPIKEATELCRRFSFDDPKLPIDNRIAIRCFLVSRGIANGPLFDRIVKVYDNGWYKKSNGKSSPIVKVPRFIRKAGFKKDIAAVRHDYDYYRGFPPQKEAEQWYLTFQIKIGYWKPWAWIEYIALRLLGESAWKYHEKKRKKCTKNIDEKIIRYGTDEYIPYLPDDTEGF